MLFQNLRNMFVTKVSSLQKELARSSNAGVGAMDVTNPYEQADQPRDSAV